MARHSGLVGLSLSGLVLALPAGEAIGTVTIGPQVRVDGTGGGPANETAIVVSPLNRLEVVAGANDYRHGDSKVGYGISLDGGATWLDGVLVPPPAQVGFGAHGDPMICSDPRTGDFWVGGIVFSRSTPANGIFVARKRAGLTTFDPSVVVVNNTAPGSPFEDKPLMASGRDPVNAAQTNLYIAWTRFTGGADPLMATRSTDLGATWSPGVNTGVVGQGAAPVVLSDGRVVVIYFDFVSSIRAVRSLNAGATWLPSVPVSGPMGVMQEGNIPGGFRTPTLPGIAVDRRNDHIYAVYNAQSTPGSANIDAFLARSTDGGASFPTVVRVPDPAPASDQFFPWVAVDGQGGVNVLWYDTRHVVQSDSAPHAFLDAYYARVTGFGTPDQAFETHRLTTASFSTAGDFGGAFIGDYQQITANGNTVYPCYMTTQGGRQHYYTRRIEVPACAADFNGDGAVSVGDVLAFLSAYSDADPRADITGDGLVNVQDFLAFLGVYSAGC